jgi:hypothetical protein
LIEERNLELFRVKLHPTRSSHFKLAVAILLIVIVVGAASFMYSPWSPGGAAQPSSAVASKTLSFKAAIIDQVGADLPNTAFVTDAEQTLTASGLNVTYYGAADATIDLYRRLPSFGYRLIVLRVHSFAYLDGNIGLFTAEPYNVSKYPFQQLTAELMKASVEPTGPSYFAITPVFVSEEMEGDFGGAIIILSSCRGLTQHNLADALIHRGASAVISWDNLVTITHTDMATEILLKALVQGSTISQAVQVAMGKVGPDPEYGSILTYYPAEAAQVTVWSFGLAQTNQATLFTKTVELVQRIHSS